MVLLEPPLGRLKLGLELKSELFPELFRELLGLLKLPLGLLAELVGLLSVGTLGVVV